MSRVKTVSSDRVGTEILEHLEIRQDESLVLLEGADFVLVKRARSSPLERLEGLASKTRERFQRLQIEPEDVEQAVKWARESS
jgi:hypothetical protein